MAIDRIGVGDIDHLYRMTGLKRYALFFDKIQIAAFSYGFLDARDRSKGYVHDCSGKVDFDFLIDHDFLSFFDTIELFRENFGESFGDLRRIGEGATGLLSPDLQQRYAASHLRDQGADAVCLGPSPTPVPVWWYLRPFSDRFSVDRIATKDLLYEIIIDGIPIPEDNVPWQDILTFRAEQTSKEQLRELRLWISETTKGELTYVDAADKIEDLKEKYKSTLRGSGMRFTLSVVRTLVVGTAELAENLIKLKLKPLFDAPFRVLDARTELLDMERKAPGRELRYLVHVENSFPRR